MGKKGDLSDFERGIVVGARRAALSISKTADLQGFSHTTIFRVYREPTNLQQLHDAIMLIWTKISNTLLNLCHEELRHF